MQISGEGHSCVGWLLLFLSLGLPSSFAASGERLTAVGGGLEGKTIVKFVAKFDALEAASAVERWKTYTNEHGNLAWGTSYLLDAYLDMLEATRDRRYLDKFTVFADALAERTDAERGLTDYKGRKRVGWGAVSYSRTCPEM